ncbi:MAG TPA: Rab family GTPase [Candidatus Lokiarchaeia archaeon]|nr:Rab family GTPase [Candidatus Lokiarchaeia archaeon]
MSSLLLSELLANFINTVENVKALLVTDLDGLILASHLGSGLDEQVLGVLSSIVKPILDKFKQEFSFKNFGSASFDTEEYRLIFLDTGRNAVVAVVLDVLGSIDLTMPVAYLLAEKVARIVEEQPVTVDIPRISLYVDTESEQNRLKNQIYQLRLKEGRYRFKFVVIGDAGVGKTSVIMQFVEGKFEEDYRATIGLNVLAHSYTLMGNTEILFQIWDIGAQDYFRRVRSSYYTGAHACYILYDITNRESFDHVQAWYDEMMQHVGTCPVVLIGNKADLEADRQVSAEEALQLAQKIEASFLETSAKTGQNVEDAFSLMGYKLVQGEQVREEETLKMDIFETMQALFDQSITPFLGILNEYKLWNPLFDIFMHMPVLGDVRDDNHSLGKRETTFTSGVKLASLSIEALEEIPDMSFFQGARGVMCLFNGHQGTDKVAEWRSYIVNLIEATQPACAILVGIQCSEEQMNQFIDAFDLNPLLEANPSHGVLFFNVSEEYNIELLDNIKILLDSLPP